MNRKPLAPPCPCGSGLPYARCCEPWHQGAPAPTAASLMRSRYAAYVLKLNDYLLATWHPDTRPEVSPETLTDNATRWLGLTVKRHEQQDEARATVEFVARFRTDGRGHRLHEVSHFVRDGERWYYVDGDID